MNKLKLIALVLIITFLVSLGAGCISSGRGESDDTVYGIEYSGIPWKTYKVYLTHDQGLPSKNGQSNFDGTYTVDKDNTEVIKKLQDAKATQQRVKIIYEEQWIPEPWKYTGTTVIVDVQPLS